MAKNKRQVDEPETVKVEAPVHKSTVPDYPEPKKIGAYYGNPVTKKDLKQLKAQAKKDEARLQAEAEQAALDAKKVAEETPTEEK